MSVTIIIIFFENVIISITDDYKKKKIKIV